MAEWRQDSAACTQDACPMRESCARWQAAQRLAVQRRDRQLYMRPEKGPCARFVEWYEGM